MSKIAVLPEVLINKIAAGEVIERPASVVRELIDNSIDAGSSRIDVEVLHGGKKLIRVSDDGIGMSREDALLCFERHATSKIGSEDDLFDLSTMGFRGEAVPAIASVSKSTLITYSGGADLGVKIEIGADHKKVVADAPPVKGTSLEIRDIFYNTPARRKFLKTNPTELSHIIETVVQKAFAYPSTAFSLRHNNSELLDLPPASDLKERFGQLYGADMAGEFREIREEVKGIKVYGFTGMPGHARGSRSHQLIFVNKRPVKNPTVNHAIYNAYESMIPKGRHPSYFIFLDLDPRKVDVNVHPAKREVKFERSDEIHRIVGTAVYSALNPGKIKEAASSTSVDNISGGEFSKDPNCHYDRHGTKTVSEPIPSFMNNSQTDFFGSGLTPDVRPFFHLGDAFVATVSDDGLLIIDQHAAHERVLYEKFFKKTSIESEQLFLPLRVELPVKEYNLIIKHKEFLNSIGLDIEDFGSNNVIVRALPRELSRADMKGLLLDLAAGILQQATGGFEGDISEGVLLKEIAARLACHKSVRGSEQLTDTELSEMMADLGKADEPDKCPHGRPTRIALSHDDLKKMFKRK